MTMQTSRVAVWRAARLAPDGGLTELADALAGPAAVAPLGRDEVAARFTRYLLDPQGRALIIDDEPTAAWVAASPLVRPWGPGGAAPVADEVAAVIAAAATPGLTPELLAARWSPRADALIAAVVARLSDDDGAAALAALRAPGPDEALLRLALTQAGRALAWAPHLHDRPVAAALVDELAAAFAAGGPPPRQHAVASVLGAIGRSATPAGEAARAALEAGLATARAALAEGDPEQPDPAAWAQAHLAAGGLGAAAPHAPDAYLAWHAAVEAAWEGPLPPAYFDGLIAAGNAAPLATLVEAMATGDPEARAAALDLAGQLPLDDAAPALVALARDPAPALRVGAVRALVAIGAVDQVMAALDDDVPEVAAAAALALVDLGLRDRVRTRRPDDPELTRQAAVAAATGALDTQTLGELAVALIDRLMADDDLASSPLVAALGAALWSSVRGLARATALVDGIPAVAPILALALPRAPEPAPAFVAPAALLDELTRALVDATVDDPPGRLLVLALVARLSGGAPERLEPLWAALADDPDAAPPILLTLADLSTRTPRAGAALAPHLAPDAPTRPWALAAAGAVLPVDDPAWAAIRAAVDDPDPDTSAAAWSALVARARRG
jgi:hypothetical protein